MSADHQKFVLHGQRWFQLGVFSMAACLNNVICFSFAPFNRTARHYYGRSRDEGLEWFITCFFIVYVLFSFPASWIVRKKGLRFGVVVGGWLQGLGCLIRVAASLPFWDSADPGVHYRCALVGQTLAAFAQPFFVNPPGMLAAAWFGISERTFATTIACNSNPFGVAVAFALGSTLVRIQRDVTSLLVAEAWFALALAVVLSLTFKAQAPTPPSRSQYLLMEIKSKANTKDVSIDIPAYFDSGVSTVFEIVCKLNPGSEVLTKQVKFSGFADLDRTLSIAAGRLPVRLPPRHIFKHTDTHELKEERRKALAKYLRGLCSSNLASYVVAWVRSGGDQQQFASKYQNDTSRLLNSSADVNVASPTYGTTGVESASGSPLIDPSPPFNFLDQLRNALTLLPKPGFRHTVVAFAVAEGVMNIVAATIDELTRGPESATEASWYGPHFEPSNPLLSNSTESALDHFERKKESLKRGRLATELFVGVFGAIFVCSSMLGSALIGVLADRWQSYKKIILFCLSSSLIGTASLVVMAECGEHESEWFQGWFALWPFILLGFFLGPIQPIAIEVAVEVAYPASEELCCTVQQILGNIFSALALPLSATLAVWFGSAVASCCMLMACIGGSLLFFAGFDGTFHRMTVERAEGGGKS